jgi:SAM-dependent methyltransferase
MPTKWTAEQVLELTRAFQPACIVAAAAELDIFTALAERPVTAASLATKLGAETRATAVLLDALAALDLLEKQQDRYSIPAEVAEILAEQSPQNVLPGVRHLGNCLRRWAQLAQVTKTGTAAQRVPSIRGQEADTAAFIGAMHNFCAPVADEVIERLRPLTFRHVLDIGGASGTWTIAFLRAAPNAEATLFDLPEAIPLARKRIAEAGLSNRVNLVAGDFYEDDLPGGADFAWVSAITHQNSRSQNRALFAKVHAALAEDGVIAIRDVVMDNSRTRPAAGALFAVNMLVGTEAGGTYTFDEFQQDLLHAGFTNVTLIHHDKQMNSLIRAEKRERLSPH